MVPFEPQLLAVEASGREGREVPCPRRADGCDATLCSALPLQWERLWFLLLVCTFSLTLTWLYFWWGVHNDYDEFNW